MWESGGSGSSGNEKFLNTRKAEKVRNGKGRRKKDCVCVCVRERERDGRLRKARIIITGTPLTYSI